MRRQSLVTSTGLILLLGGISVMCGWLLHIPLWEKISPTGVLMVFPTALCFTLYGFSFISSRLFPRRATTIRLVISGIVATIASLMLVESFFGVDLGIDIAELHRWYQDKNPHPGRMAPNTAIAFLFAGVALLLGTANRRIGAVYHILAASIITLGLIGLVGYTLLFDLAYGWYDIPRMAFTTGIGIVILGTALLFDHPDALSLISQKTASANSRAVEDARVYIFLGVAVTILGLVFFVSYGSIRTLMDRIAWVDHTDAVRTEFEAMMAVDSRGYYAWRSSLITGAHDSLNEAVTAGSEMSVHMTNLHILTADNPLQHQRLEAMQRLIEANDSLLRGNNKTGPEDNADIAKRALAHEAALLANRQAFYSLVTGFRDEENRLMLARQTQSQKSAFITIIVIVVGNFLGFAILFYAGWLLNRLNNSREKLERSLQQNEERTRLIIESVTDYAIIALDLNGRILTWNSGAQRIKGYLANEIIGQHFSCLYLSEDIARGEPDRILLVAATEGQCESEGWRLRKDGTKFWANVICNPLRDGSGQMLGYIKITRDLTERKKTEDLLQRSYAFLDSLIENLPILIFVKDASDLRYVRLNKGVETMRGLSNSDFLGKTDHDFLTKEEADALKTDDLALLAGEISIKKSEIQRSSRDTGMRILSVVKVAVFDSLGKPIFVLGIAEDITDRRRSEQEIFQLNLDLKSRAKQLAGVNKELLGINKELESFTYSVSHDLRAPLRAVNGYAQMLEEDCYEHLNKDGLRYISQIINQSRQMGELIDDLLRFSRLGRQAVTKIPLDMNQLVKDIIHNELGDYAHRLSNIIMTDLPNSNADPVLLRQVWVNLLSNAFKYSNKTEKPIITLSGHLTDKEAIYSVKDNGAGFDMTYYKKLFGVFQRLHRSDEFEGTGVGLAIVQRIIFRHGGRVWAKAKPDHGAEFLFSLPLETLQKE